MINQLPDWTIQMLRKKFIRHFLLIVFTKSVISAEHVKKTTEFKCFIAENSFKNEVMVNLDEKYIWSWKNRPPQEICLKITVRNDDSVWWYDIPPTVHSCLENFEFCKPYPKNENSILLDFEVPVSPSGFSEIRATVVEKWQPKDELFQITSLNYLVKSFGKTLPNDFNKNAEMKMNRIRHQRAENWIDYRTVAAEYIPHRRYSEIYDFKDSFLHPKLKSYVNAGPEERNNHIEELTHDIFRIPIFTDNFIKKFNEEIDNAEKLRDAGTWKPNPPNNMNKYGFRLREMGFFDFIDDFYNSKYIRFLLSNLLKDWRGNEMDFIHPFIISYENKDDSQLELDVHMDDAEITMNLCIKGDWDGNEVYFDGVRTDPDPKKITLLSRPGYAVIHAGQNSHGANKIKKGFRRNLVFWFKSQNYRNSPAELYNQHCNDDTQKIKHEL